MTTSLRALSRGALAELDGVFERLPETAADAFMDAIVAARRIAFYGCGREGLQVRGFCMRLFHMGRDVHMVGDMTTPPVGPGDLFVATAGPGALPTAEALMQVARDAGATVALITAQPGGKAAALADVLLVIPAQTMADDRASKTSVLPMGSLFETAQMVLFELLILRLRDRVGETPETMRARHTNLE
ncbi:MAG: SIS domain-containing protein [Geminicoccaceae bacterium]